jgi:hypothetical protein
LQETTSNPRAVAPLASALNTFYGVPGMYTNSPYQATESGGVTNNGNGPNAIVFNTRSLRLLASLPIDPPGGTSKLGSSSGEYREAMRYQFAPAGVATNSSNVFYIYVSHYKSGTGTANAAYRAGEAQIIRNHVSTNLPATARVLFVGDFNTGDASEAMFATLTSPGANQAIDPINPLNDTGLDWDGNSQLEVKSFSPVAIHYRDDYQMMTTNVYFGTPGGLTLFTNTYHIFGNNGTTPYLGNVTTNVNTALLHRLITNGPVFLGATQLYADLTTASDHLPAVADYAVPLPAPRITALSLVDTNLTFTVSNGITNAVYSVLANTNLTGPATSWNLITTYTATNGIFTFTATNAFNRAARTQFYRLQVK